MPRDPSRGRRRSLLARGEAPAAPENLRDHLKAFLAFLELNRNVSVHTVRAYDSDVARYFAFLAAERGRRISELRPADLDGASVRAWVGSLNRAGQARATVARKLSGARAFVQYLRREGVITADPTAAAVAPRLDKTIPVHLSEAEITTLLDSIDAGTALGRRDRAMFELYIGKPKVVHPLAAHFDLHTRCIDSHKLTFGGSHRHRNEIACVATAKFQHATVLRRWGRQR